MQQVPERHLDSATQPSFDELSRRYKVLLHATDLAARRGFPDLLQDLSQLLRELFDFNFLNYAIRDDQADLMRVHMVDEELRWSTSLTGTGCSGLWSGAENWDSAPRKPSAASSSTPIAKYMNLYLPDPLPENWLGCCCRG